MLYALGVIAFAVGLLASIALHEIGHLVPAKKFGVRVTQYMVGFGPTLWSAQPRRHRVRRQGHPARRLHPDDRHGAAARRTAAGRVGRAGWATLVEEFRATSRTEVTAADDETAQFYRLTPGKKIIVMLGGPSMNLLIFSSSPSCCTASSG